MNSVKDPGMSIYKNRTMTTELMEDPVDEESSDETESGGDNNDEESEEDSTDNESTTDNESSPDAGKITNEVCKNVRIRK